ncbi:hypothetical protein ABPG75_000316 [Micractinium tetrahymenae]
MPIWSACAASGLGALAVRELRPTRLRLAVDEAEACALHIILEAQPLACLELRVSFVAEDSKWAGQGGEEAPAPVAEARQWAGTAALLAALAACSSLQALELGAYHLRVGLREVSRACPCQLTRLEIKGFMFNGRH